LETSPLPYRVRLGSIGLQVPLLLRAFAQWLARQPYGALGCFTLDARALPDDQLMSFATLPNDRCLAIDPETGAVIMRWANGNKRELANSLTAFLTALSESNTGVIALDAGNARARADLAKWLRDKPRTT
jgi:hypothetical protein